MDVRPEIYGADTYVTMKDIDNNVLTQFLFANSRVAQIKELALPRLELEEGVISSRMAYSVFQKVLPPSTPVFVWTDSAIIAGWIYGPNKRWDTLAANRVMEILSTAQPIAKGDVVPRFITLPSH